MASARASKTAGPGHVFHDVLPPPLRVVVPGGRGQFADRIGRAAPSAPSPAMASWCAAGRSQNRTGIARAERVADRLPLRREHRERPERRRLGLPGHVPQQRHRRPHLRVTSQFDQPVGLGRPLDQHHVRLELGQCLPQRPRRPRPVMPDAVQRADWSLPGHLAAGAVEVAPVVSLAHHGLQVLLPRHPVGHGILDDRAGDAAAPRRRRGARRRRSARPARGRW